MGTIFTTSSTGDTERITWPIRNFYHADNETELDIARFSMWDPRKYKDLFKYPNKEPAKDF